MKTTVATFSQLLGEIGSSFVQHLVTLLPCYLISFCRQVFHCYSSPSLSLFLALFFSTSVLDLACVVMALQRVNIFKRSRIRFSINMQLQDSITFVVRTAPFEQNEASFLSKKFKLTSFLVPFEHRVSCCKIYFADLNVLVEF